MLRTLAGIEPKTEPRYRLGVVWYLWQDSDWAYEPKLKYLSEPSRFRHYDENLFDALHDMANCTERTVSEVMRREILGKAEEEVVFWPVDVPDRRKRCRWLSRALKKTEGTQIVFLDPDNGLPTSEREARLERSRLHAYRNEMRRFVERGQTVVLYQSYWRINKGDTHETEVFKWRHERLTELHLDEHPRVIGSDRMFIVLPAALHVEHIDRRLRDFVKRWGDHFTLQAL